MTIRIDGTNTAANPGITGSDTDTGLQFGTDEVNIVTGGSTAVTVDSSQRVGINTTSPSQRLNLNIGGDQTWLQIDKTRAADEAMIQLVHSTTNRGSKIRYANADSSWVVGIDGSENFLFTSGEAADGSGGTERARFLSTGGLTFNGDTATANALDDYEEGTFVPTITRETSNPTVSYSYQTGSYVKIGRSVLVYFDLNISSISGGTGRYAVSNLPFPTATDGSNGGYGSPQFRSSNAFNSDARINNTSAFHVASRIDLLYMNSSASEVDITVSTGRITGWSVYMTND